MTVGLTDQNMKGSSELGIRLPLYYQLMFMSLIIYFEWCVWFRAPPLEDSSNNTSRWRVFVHPSQQFVMLCLSGTVIHSWVSKLHVLPLQSYCFSGAVNGKTEFTTEGVFHSFAPGINISNPFQCMSFRLSDPMCRVGTNRIRDLTADGQRLTRLNCQRLWLSKLFTVHTCWELLSWMSFLNY